VTDAKLDMVPTKLPFTASINLETGDHVCAKIAPQVHFDCTLTSLSSAQIVHVTKNAPVFSSQVIFNDK